MTNNLKKPYPFSDHDNKKTLENCGEHFDKKLGRKINSDESQHCTSPALLSWDHPTTMSSLQTESYIEKSYNRSEITRYPKHYDAAVRKIKGPSVSDNSHKLIFPLQEQHPTPLAVIAETQPRDKSAHLWAYSYH